MTAIFPNHISGNTFLGIQFEILVNSVALDLTNASIKMVLTTPYSKTANEFSTEGNNIAITDAVNGKFEFSEQIVTLTPNTYTYGITLTLGNGNVFTYITGSWTIL